MLGMFFAEGLFPHALLYWLFRRFWIRGAPAPWWVHGLMVGAAVFAGAVARMGAIFMFGSGAGADAGIFWALVAPAVVSLSAAVAMRLIMGEAPVGASGNKPAPVAQRAREPIPAVPPRPMPLRLAALWVSGALAVPAAMAVFFGGIYLAFGSSEPASTHPAPTVSTHPVNSAAVASREDTWDQHALSWETQNADFLADKGRAEAMQRAIADVERIHGGTIDDEALLQLAQAQAFRETGWRAAGSQ